MLGRKVGLVTDQKEGELVATATAVEMVRVLYRLPGHPDTDTHTDTPNDADDNNRILFPLPASQ